MFAFVLGLAYFLAVYLFETQSDPLASQLGMSALHTRSVQLLSQRDPACATTPLIDLSPQ